jgi:hypothetical protein
MMSYVDNNLAKCNGQGKKTCKSCHKQDTIRHLFFNLLLVLQTFLVNCSSADEVSKTSQSCLRFAKGF